LLTTSTVASAATTKSPTLTITTAPPNPTSSRSATIGWSATGWLLTTSTSLDGAAFVARSGTTVTYSGLSLGSHKVVVRVSNRWGTVQKTVSWTMMNPPDVTITQPPPSTTTQTSASIGWSASNATAVTASLDGGPAQTAINPQQLSGLQPGTHTLALVASNPVGSDAATTTWTVTTSTSTTTSTTTGTTTYVSDLPYTVAANGWGPVEQAAGDGRTITLNGVTYAKGLGVHAASDVSVALDSCTRFQSDVGVDDEVGSNGSVVFQVYVDGVKKFESPLLGGSSATVGVDVDVTGGKTLRLVVTNGGDNSDYDHADWAAARVTCAASPVSPDSSTAGITSTSSTSSGGTPTGSATGGVAAPAPPSSYGLPSGAIRVTTVAELKAALTGTTPNIVLADGTYDAGTYLSLDGSHSLYAEHLGGAVLKSGLFIGSNFGSGGTVVRGLAFDVSSTSEMFSGAIVWIWGAGGANTQVLDCTFDGNRVAAFGLYAYNPQGLVAQRLSFRDFTDVALRASDNKSVSYGSSTPTIQSISDIQIDGVSRSTPGSSDGTAEAGLWVGHPVASGVQRIRVRNVSWSGIETVNNSWNTTFTDLDIDMRTPVVSAGVGVYMEHFNYHNTFRNFVINGAKMGFVGEWSDPSWNGIAGSHFSTITNGTIDAAGAASSKTWGIYLDEGTEATTVTYVTFRNQSFAAIDAYKNVGTNVFQNNDTSGILSTAKPISYVHYSSSSP